MTFSLDGKVALVTGGSKGIGRATALAFARAGADVVVASRKSDELEKVADEIRDLGKRSAAVTTHMGRMDDVRRLVSLVTKQLGRIDILVNNAVVSPAMGPVMGTDERLWDAIFNVNLKGLFFLAQEVARTMKDNGGGKIINVSSVSGLKPDMHLGIYSISKAAVIMATKVMALEWASHNIRVNAIAPGRVHTRLLDSFNAVVPGGREATVERTPMRRVAEPDEIVGAMIYLASDASSFMTGETLVLDGGLSLT